MAPAKPTIIPYWTDGAANKVAQPTASASAQGFTAGQPPPFEYVNWLFYQLGSWVGYLNEAQNSTTMSTSLNDLLRLINGGRWTWALGTNTLAWSLPFNLAIPSVADSANQAAAGSVVLADGQIAYVTANIPFSSNGDLTQGSNQIQNLSYELGISVGQAIVGTGIPAGVVVTAISGTTVTMSDNATATATQQALTFSSSGALTVQTATSASFLPGANSILIARRVGNQIMLGANSTQSLLRDGENKQLNGHGYTNTVAVPAGMPLAARTPVYVSQGGADANVLPTNTTSGSASVSVTDSSMLYAGMGASGPGIPSGATIASVSGTALTLSAPATATASSVGVTYTRVPGALYACDASIANGPNRTAMIGFTVAGYAAGAAATYVTGGVLFGFTGLTPGALYYVDPSTVGGITVGRPSVVGQTIAPVGMALGGTTLNINPSGGSANQMVTSALAWANYSARNEAEFAAALTAASNSNGGVLLLLNAMTLSASYTLPGNLILQGRKGASVITMLAGATLNLADYADIRDVNITSAAANSTLVQMSGNAAAIKSCAFAVTPNAAIVCVNITGNANRLYNCTFAGVSNGSSSVGIAYTSGARNIDDSTYIIS